MFLGWDENGGHSRVAEDRGSKTVSKSLMRNDFSGLGSRCLRVTVEVT